MNAELVLNFLKELARNNNREWFQAHRDMYLAAKEEIEKLIQTISAPLIALNPELAGYTDPKTAMYRIFRDIRFSPDKTPYKNHFGIFFVKGGRNVKVHFPGYYIHIQPDESFICGGVWLPEPNMLKAIRQEVVYNTEALKGIITEKKFKKFYNSVDEDMMLKRIPAGFPQDFQFPEYLRTKSYTFSSSISNEDLASDHLPEIVLERFSAIHPMIRFLNEAIENCD